MMTESTPLVNHDRQSDGEKPGGFLPTPIDFAGDLTALTHRQQIMEQARRYREAQVLITCAELRVFETLAAGPLTAIEIATAIEADPRGVELLLNAAVSLDLLDKHDNRYLNTVLTAACLAQPDEFYLGEALRRESAFLRRWTHLTEAVKTGQRPIENVRDEHADDWVRTFERALYDMARPLAPIIAEALALPEDRPLRVIDVGGGHGGYSLALAQRYPLLTATVFELPRVVPVAREIIAEVGLSDRVVVQEGDFQREELGDAYDVALVFGVLNGEPPDKRPELIRKVFTVLQPGGRIVLRDFVLNADRAGPPDAALFAVQMVLSTDAGGLNTRDELIGWLIDAGFDAPYAITLPAGVGSSLTIGVKPL